jgi:hypothetical protein
MRLLRRLYLRIGKVIKMDLKYAARLWTGIVWFEIGWVCKLDN